MDEALVVQFWLVAVVLAFTPGADWAYAIAAGLRARSVAPSVLGLLCGYLVIVIIVALGVGLLVARYPMALTLLTVVGGGYLLYLGVSTLLGGLRTAGPVRLASPEGSGDSTLSEGGGLRVGEGLDAAGSSDVGGVAVRTRVRPDAEVDRGVDRVGRRALAQFLRGAGVSGFNPKGLLLLLALLPQFTSATGWPAPAQMMVLGSLHILDCAVVYTAVALLARHVLRSRPGLSAVVTGVSGVVMVLLGAAILLERLLGWP